MRFKVYSRAWCHLCDDLRAALEPLAARYGVPVDVIDVDSDAALDERFGELVPVLYADDIELCHYHLDTARVLAVLEAGSPNGAAGAASPGNGQSRADFG